MSFNRNDPIHVVMLYLLYAFFVWMEVEYIIYAFNNHQLVVGRPLAVAFGLLLVAGTTGVMLILLADSSPRNKFIAESGELSFGGMMLVVMGMMVTTELEKHTPMVDLMLYSITALVVLTTLVIFKRIWAAWSKYMEYQKDTAAFRTRSHT
jgi:hypothetical protein